MRDRDFYFGSKEDDFEQTHNYETIGNLTFKPFMAGSKNVASGSATQKDKIDMETDLGRIFLLNSERL